MSHLGAAQLGAPWPPPAAAVATPGTGRSEGPLLAERRPPARGPGLAGCGVTRGHRGRRLVGTTGCVGAPGPTSSGEGAVVAGWPLRDHLHPPVAHGLPGIAAGIGPAGRGSPWPALFGAQVALGRRSPKQPHLRPQCPTHPALTATCPVERPLGSFVCPQALLCLSLCLFLRMTEGLDNLNSLPTPRRRGHRRTPLLPPGLGPATAGEL